MDFDAALYGEKVGRLLSLEGGGQRLIPLVAANPSSAQARDDLKKVAAAKPFAHARSPQGALAGLWLYFSCFDEAHGVAQDDPSPEGSLWHAILHRQEPDPGNSAYWFRSAGPHAIFPALARDAAAIVARYPEAGFHPAPQWDPFAFIDFCERARLQAGTSVERAALEIQRAEWQLLFDYCARPGE